VQKQIAPTLNTTTTSTSFVVKVDEQPKIMIDGNVAKNGRESGDVFNPNGIAPTLLARDGKDPKKITVVVDNMKTKLANELIDSGTVKGGEIINHSYTTSVNRPELVDYIETDNGLSPCLTTRPDILGYVEKKVEQNNLRIRKLTPKECYRLMGFSDQAFDLASPNQSNTSLYHQAGDSIVVDVLENILKELL
jgi:DNA (cytosine-5)-methyltransferase 1